MSTQTEKAVTIHILGKEYHVSCPAGEEYELRQAASDLNEKMATVKASGKVIGLERIAVMVALNINHELLQRRAEIKTLTLETETRITQLMKKLETLLPENDN